MIPYNITHKTEREKMRKLALNDEILLNIEKPARYIGNEINSVMKDKEKVAIRFAMCFPDVYEIGMSHLGIQILYDMFNRREDTWCERVYSPWIDLDRIMREQHIPLFALESQDPIQDFDFLGYYDPVRDVLHKHFTGSGSFEHPVICVRPDRRGSGRYRRGAMCRQSGASGGFL